LSAVLVTAPLLAHAELVDRVAAVVNNQVIAWSEVEQRAAPELARVAAERDAARRGKLREQVMRAAVEQLVGEKLLELEVREFNIEVTDAELEVALEDVRRQNNVEPEQFAQLLAQEGYTPESYKAFMRKHLARLKLVNLKVRSRVKVSEEDLRAEYARFSRMEGEDPEVHARHILVKVDPGAAEAAVKAAAAKAQELAAEARKAGVDFVELARAKSEGPSASDGGDLGFFKRGMMVPEFDKVAFKLQPGEVSEPVRTRFGFHVIKVEERRAADVSPFDDVKDQLRERLLRAQMEKFTAQYVAELRQKANVEVKP
jgi:peptidyl-prolyl cis-trans isomerase SurA